MEIISLFSFCQDAALTARLNSFIKANDELNFDKILDFTYPKVFTIAPREKMKEALEEGFNSEEIKMKKNFVFDFVFSHRPYNFCNGTPGLNLTFLRSSVQHTQTLHV